MPSPDFFWEVSVASATMMRVRAGLQYALRLREFAGDSSCPVGVTGVAFGLEVIEPLLVVAFRLKHTNAWALLVQQDILLTHGRF
jgi:hypothetical protein